MKPRCKYCGEEYGELFCEHPVMMSKRKHTFKCYDWIRDTCGMYKKI